jgi:polar amino acid transport system substrate-binding protein
MNRGLIMSAPAWTLLAFVVGASGCDLPRDPEGTLERVRNGTLRVGVLHEPPWASTAGPVVRGVEAQLVNELAEELGANVEWKPGSAQHVLDALEHGAIDLAVGGLLCNLRGGERLALTRPYFTTRILVGAANHHEAILRLGGQPVAVQTGDLACAALARQKGGTPVEKDRPAEAGMLVAAEAWRLEAWGLTTHEPTIAKREHVFAAPPGENGWLVHLDLFLHRRRPDVPALLQAELEP